MTRVAQQAEIREHVTQRKSCFRGVALLRQLHEHPEGGIGVEAIARHQETLRLTDGGSCLQRLLQPDDFAAEFRGFAAAASRSSAAS